MKRISLYFLVCIIIVVSLSCSLGSVLEAGEDNVPPVSITSEASLVNPPVIVTALPMSSTIAGFQTGTVIDSSTLPDLTAVGEGGEPSACYSEINDPSINLGYGIFPYQSLCLNNFPTAPDSPGITVTLVDPSGQSYMETFTYSPDGMLNAKGIKSGHIESGEGIDGNPGTPGVSLELYLPASLPCGEWTAMANTLDGSLNVGPSNLSVDCTSPRRSVLAEDSSSPFVSPAYSWDGPSFTPGETLTVFGSAYPANTTITVALYHQDPANADQYVALHAVSIQSDASGNFQVPFMVGIETSKGAYDVIAAPVIDPTLRLHPFGARFLIE